MNEFGGENIGLLFGSTVGSGLETGGAGGGVRTVFCTLSTLAKKLSKLSSRAAASNFSLMGVILAVGVSLGSLLSFFVLEGRAGDWCFTSAVSLISVVV